MNVTMRNQRSPFMENDLLQAATITTNKETMICEDFSFLTAEHAAINSRDWFSAE